MESHKNQDKREAWIKVISDCESRQGGSISGWLKANGIKIRRYYYWAKKLREESFSETETAKFMASEEALEASFVDITTIAAKCITKAPESSPFEIALQFKDCQVKITGSVDEANLLKVIRAIRHA